MLGKPDIQEVTIDDVRLLDGPNQILVSLTVQADVPLSLAIEWDDYQSNEEVRGFVGSSDRFQTLFTDTDVEASIAMSLVMNPDTFQVLAAEVDEILASSGSTKFSPHPRRSSKALA